MGNNEDLPKRLSQSSATKLLRDEGWKKAKGGKHVVKMTKPGHRPITLPQHHGQDYGVGLTSRILQQAGLKGATVTTDSDNERTEGEQQ